MRKLKIKTRLLITFFIIVFLTFIVGYTGFTSLNSIKDSEVNTIRYVNIFYGFYENNSSFITSMGNIIRVGEEDALWQNFMESSKESLEKLNLYADEYIKVQSRLSIVFSPGERQDISNLLEMLNDAYIPLANKIIDLSEQGMKQEAEDLYYSQLYPIYNIFANDLSEAYQKNLEYAKTNAIRNSENASNSTYLMAAIILASIVVSIILALRTTRSIADPLLEIGVMADRVAGGELDVRIDSTKGNDEFSHLKRKLSETLEQMTLVQRLKLETLEAKLEKEKAEASTRSKSDFLAKMSHEIRTPMNAITGMAELALRDGLPDSAREHILTIKQAGANLISIINDILDLSKIESGKLEIAPRNYLFSSLINDVISIIRMRALESNILFMVNTDSNIPNALFGDEIRIRQILLNILGNAVKYTENGYVSLAVTGEITSQNTVSLVIEVSDSGRGIKPEDIEKIYDGFIQVDIGANRGIEGTGLGLAITRSLVKAMGGDISARSEYGVGSTFTVRLPQSVQSQEKLATVEDPGKKGVLVYEAREIYGKSIVCTINNLDVACKLVSTASGFEKELASGTYPFVFIASSLYENVKAICAAFESEIKIALLAEFGEIAANRNLSILSMPVHSISVANVLNGLPGAFSYGETGATVSFAAPDASVIVVDDVNTNLNVSKGLLLLYEIQAKLCKSGMEAIEAITSGRYDLVLMDHMMPGMNGIEATARIRALGDQDPYYKNVPVIALTANAVSGTREMFLKNGFDDFLSKPIDMVKLNEILEKWIPKEKQRRNISKTSAAPTAMEYGAHQEIKIEGLDTRKGIANTGGTIEKYMQILAIFHQDGLEKTIEIKNALNAGNLELYVTFVHALKSAAANIGAYDLSETAKALEIAGNQENMEYIQAHNTKLLSSLESIVININNVLKASKQDRPDSAVDTAAMKANLIKLNEAIDKMNPGAIAKAVKDIRPFTETAETGVKIQSILQCVLIGEYDDAASMINTLLED